MKFAKVFDIGDEQVLATRKYDSEDNDFKLVVETEVEGLHTSAAFGFSEEEPCSKAFDEYDLEKATTFLNSVHQMISEAGPSEDENQSEE